MRDAYLSVLVRRSSLVVSLVASGAALCGCHDAGPYGHAPRYAELDDERAEVAGARGKSGPAKTGHGS